MQNEVRLGRAPAGIERVDVGKVRGEQPHVHFTRGRHALNKDGTWKHGGGLRITNAQRKWLTKNGWTVPS
jgi:hypothetical protein